MMPSDKHTHSIHIDAPVEKVFHYIEDPAHFVAAMPEESNITLGAVNRSPEGTVSTYEVKYRELGMHLTGVFTREEYVVNERIVDHSSLGPIFTFSVEADDSGTTLTASWDASTLMKMLDAVFFHGDKDIERALATYKVEIEALA
ncbi:SRPBCC family protein [Cryobacterium sp. Sr8]|nr:SRPBCC family protein [Cryobacterium sp. Sr8]